MSVENQHQDFVERNGGIGVFKWIIKQDGLISDEDAKIYPIIAWNEYFLDKLIVIGSAYRYNNYFIVINYEDDFSNYPKEIADWIDESMDISKLDNIVEVFRDNHLIAIYDESMQIMNEWYAEDLDALPIDFATYNNNIIFDDEVIKIKDVKNSHANSKDEFLNNINDLLKEFLNNSTKNTPKNSSEIFNEKTFFNPIFNNPKYNSRFLDKDYPSNPSINVNSDDFDEGFKEKWA
ncbi:hypothetical protein N9E05_04825 [Gammaproteobacteria bacterium]|nr:hypothetical protein [Gammaproteobacteria bacterium]